jgi:hypothetical protein
MKTNITIQYLYDISIEDIMYDIIYDLLRYIIHDIICIITTAPLT